MDRTAIPEFFVYGEPARALGVGFLHVETVLAREAIHNGRVAAHKHPKMGQITLWTSGRGRYAIEDHAWSFSAPSASFVPSGVVHGFTIEPGSDAVVISVADTALSAIAEHSLLPLEVPAFVTGRGDPLLWERLGRVVETIQSEYKDGLPGKEKVLPPLIAVALSGIARLDADAPPLALPAPQALASRLRRLIEQHFREDWPVERYVDALGTTRHLLDKAAREVLGAGVRQAVGERRLVEAKRLLLFTISPVEEVAYACGFNDPAYFSRVFRAEVGLPPSAWRSRRVG